MRLVRYGGSVDFEEERPPPPGSAFAQGVAYVVLAISLLVTIAFALLVILAVTYLIMINAY